MKGATEYALFLKEFDQLFIEVSPVSELILALFNAFGAHNEARPGWLRSLKRKLTPRSKESLKFFFEGEDQIGLNALAFLPFLTPPRTFDSFLSLLKALDREAFVEVLLSKVDPGVPLLGKIIFKVVSKQPLKEAEQIQWQDFSGRYSSSYILQLKKLARGAFEQEDLARLFQECWEGFFKSEYARIYPFLEEEASRLAASAGLKRVEFLRKIAPGLALPSDIINKNLTLFPTFYGRPYFFTQRSDSHFLLIVPVHLREESLEESIRSKLSFAFKSLGDPTRMEILRLLAQRPMYAMEISRALSLTHPTVLHHLASLRAAGFVIAELKEGNNYYSLVPKKWEKLSEELKNFLTKR